MNMTTETAAVQLDLRHPQITGSQHELEVAKQFRVTTPELSVEAQQKRSTIRGRVKQLIAERRKLTEPLDAAKRTVMGWFNPHIEALEQATAAYDAQIIGYTQQLERKRREEQTRLDAAAAAERDRLLKIAAKADAKGQDTKAGIFEQRAAETVAPTANVEAPVAAGVHMRDNWKFRVVDAKAVKAQFLIPDEVAIGRIVKAMQLDAVETVGGIEVFNEPSVVSRT